MKLHGMGPKALGVLKAALAEKCLTFADHAKLKDRPLLSVRRDHAKKR